ncbi:malto-oligosyltrehalose trehalohydrolase [Cytophagaceae bacterium ABcell3]|nr:malto-oligosyltrehalose trehalohydrolase [Cytophagaceae bacterium ABcell3]
MSFSEVKKSIPGIRFDKEGVANVTLWAPHAQQAEVYLTQKDVKLPLEQKVYGYWQLTTEQIKSGDYYQYILNGEKKLPDPASISQPEGVHGPSQAIDLTYKWSDQSWNNIPLEDYILYELHTGTFSPEGNFEGIEKKLDYLKELGITAIEIMPVSQFPGQRNWGYDGVYPFAVQESYGGVLGLQHLVDTCHKKGIAVILDVVYNHLGPEGNYLAEYAPYFTDKYNTPWGKAINFDDAWCDGVRKYFIENTLMWFRDFHIDALRMDAVHAIKDFSPKHILREIKEHVNELQKTTGRNHHLIVELDLNDNKFITPLEDHGYGMDAQWIDEFHHALRVTTGEEKTGYYADFDGLKHLAKSYKDAYVYDGIYSPHRHRNFGTKTDNNPGKQFVVFSQNHDQTGNRMLGERSSQLVSYEMLKVMAGAVISSPYLPMLFMGEEYSETHPFLYFVSHGDPNLIEAVRKGRKAEFAAFHAKGEAPDPQDEKTFETSKLQWELLDKHAHKTLFRYYQTLIALRKKQPALKNLNRKNVEVYPDEEKQSLILHRWHENQHIVCVMNFSKQAQNINLPSVNMEWVKLLDSAAPEWNGPEAAPETLPNAAFFKLQPESFLIYTNKHD